MADLNFVRDGLVEKPEDYRWSSVGYHLQGGNKDKPLMGIRSRCFFPKIIRNDKSVLRFDAGCSISAYPRVCPRACPARHS
jgi:hypothetical protein